MNTLQRARKSRFGFTTIEILIVVALVGILAGLTVVGYGAWRHSVLASAVKSDLNGVASAMESERTFNDSYPQAVPNSFTPSSGVVVSGGGSVDGEKYCVDGTSSEDSTVTYYVSSETADQGAQEGTCATRPGLEPPAIPGNVGIGTAIGTQISVYWTAVTDAASYTAQCASDAGFVFGLQQTTSTGTNATVTDLTPSTTFYCRVKAVNGAGSSDWSETISTNTTTNYGSLAVGTSIEGYWNSPPKGFLLEDGSAISRTVYADLFSVIGTTYGTGDGSTTFNLPDSRGRTGVNQSADVEFATIGQLTGSQTEVLTIGQLASHTHIQNSHTHSVNDPGHNHSQNPHSHAQYVTAMSGGPAVRIDWNYDGAAGIYDQGAATAYATATNNYADPNLSVASTTATNQNNGSGGAHSNVQPSIVKVSAIKYSPVDPAAAQLPAGTSISGYWSDIPDGYLAEDGAAVSRTTYSDLYSAIGTTYGAGNGSTTFNVPDSRGRASVNISTDSEFNTMGEKPGSKREALTVAQLPVHTHTQNTHGHTIIDPGHNHTQNAHSHTQVVTANSGSAIRKDYNADSAGANLYPQGVNTMNATATNNPAYTVFSIDAATATNQNTGNNENHNNIQPSIVKKYAIKATAVTNTGTQLPAGTSLSGYWPLPPSGYLAENGAAVSRTTYAKLFAVIGTTYGAGDGSTTFNLPDSRGRLSVNRDTEDTMFDVIGEKTGSKTVVLTIAQIPSHTHTQNAHTHTSFDPAHTHTQNAHNHGMVVTANSGSSVRVDWDGDGGFAVYTQGSTTEGATATNNAAYTGVTAANATATNQNAGSGSAHNNIMPSIVKLFVIKY